MASIVVSDTVAGKRAMTIRFHLFLLALCALLPLLGFAVYVSVNLIEHDRDSIRGGAAGRARAMMTAADAELRGSIKTLQALAASRALDTGDLPAFHADAVRILASQPDWSNITLALPSGTQVVNLAIAFGEPLHALLIDSPSAAQVVKTLRPAVGSVTTAGPLPGPRVPLRVPVIRDGAVAYILTAAIRPESFERLIRAQNLPKNWIAALIDGNGRFVARVPARLVGALASESLRAALRNAPQGWFRGITSDGNDVFTAYLQMVSRWRAGFGNSNGARVSCWWP